MRFLETEIAGVYIIELSEISDDRGFFARTWCAQVFGERGLASTFAQANMSQNHFKGTLRGMHFQRAPHAEVKLVRCTHGAIYDVALDLRPGSPSYRRWVGVELSRANRRALYIPAGCAHGFQALEDDTDLIYQVSHPYTPGAEGGVRYDDPAFAIAWPLPVSTISPKDAAWPDYQG